MRDEVAANSPRVVLWIRPHGTAAVGSSCVTLAAAATAPDMESKPLVDRNPTCHDERHSHHVHVQLHVDRFYDVMSSCAEVSQHDTVSRGSADFHTVARSIPYGSPQVCHQFEKATLLDHLWSSKILRTRLSCTRPCSDVVQRKSSGFLRRLAPATPASIGVSEN
jgi:hypothetical protein